MILQDVNKLNNLNELTRIADGIEGLQIILGAIGIGLAIFLFGILLRLSFK